MRIFTGILAVAAVLTLFTQLFQIYVIQNKPESKLQQHIPKIDTSLQILQSESIKENIALKELLDSLIRKKH